MALITTNFLETKKYEAKKVRRALRASGVIQEGIVEKGDYTVSQRAAGVNRSVDIAAGDAWVKGDSAADQGYYHIANSAATNVSIGANASGNPRIDLVGVQINDSADAASSGDTPEFVVTQGNAKSGATLGNLKGAPGQTEGPAIPNNFLTLAYVVVANGATEIKNEHIGYLLDPRRGSTGYPALTEPKAVAGAPPIYAFGRPLGYVPSCRVTGVEQSFALESTLLCATETYDLDEMHSTSENTGRITAKTPGLYSFVAAAGHEGSFAPTPVLRLNGTTTRIGITASPGANSAFTLSGQYRLGYGDYVEVFNIGLATTIKTASITPFFAAHWVGP